MARSSDTIRNVLACGMWGTRAGWARDRHAIQRPRSKLPTPRYGALRSLARKPEVLGGVGRDPRRRHEERLAPAAHAPCVAGRQVDGRKKYEAGAVSIRTSIGADEQLVTATGRSQPSIGGEGIALGAPLCDRSAASTRMR